MLSLKFKEHLDEIFLIVFEYALFTSINHSELTFSKSFGFKTEREVREEFPILYQENLRRYNHLMKMVFSDLQAREELSQIVSKYAMAYWNVYETTKWAMEIMDKIDNLLGLCFTESGFQNKDNVDSNKNMSKLNLTEGYVLDCAVEWLSGAHR